MVRTNSSAGRSPDGNDRDSNCTDFVTHPATTMPESSAAGATNVKVASVAGFKVGQPVVIDTGANLEKVIVAEVGSSGATTAGGATNAGATSIPVASARGFAAGQTITIDSGANHETAVVASIRMRRDGAAIVVETPLKFAHAAGAQVAGTGITLTSALKRSHEAGTQVNTAVPTPGASNN